MAIPPDQYEVAPPVEHGWAALHTMLSKDTTSDELKSVWTTAALVLKGYDAVPVELKILLDRLFATYHESVRMERRHRLAYLGWSEEEYERGYKIVVSRVLRGPDTDTIRGLQLLLLPLRSGGSHPLDEILVGGQVAIMK